MVNRFIGSKIAVVIFVDMSYSILKKLLSILLGLSIGHKDIFHGLSLLQGGLSIKNILITLNSTVPPLQLLFKV